MSFLINVAGYKEPDSHFCKDALVSSLGKERRQP